MPKKGENIRKRKDGRWEGRYKRGVKENGSPDYGSVYGKTYKEVKEKLAIAKQNIDCKSASINSERKFSAAEKGQRPPPPGPVHVPCRGL